MSGPGSAEAEASFGLCHECKDKNCERCIGPPCEWFIYTTDERGWGDTILWWKEDECGYSRFVEEAGAHSLQEAETIVKSGHNVAMVKAPEAFAAARRVVRIQDLRGAEENYQKARAR